MTMKEFVSHCTARGSDWTGMIASGIKELWPDEWDKLPETFSIHQVLEVLDE